MPSDEPADDDEAPFWVVVVVVVVFAPLYFLVSENRREVAMGFGGLCVYAGVFGLVVTADFEPVFETVGRYAHVVQAAIEPVASSPGTYALVAVSGVCIVLVGAYRWHPRDEQAEGENE